MDYSDINYVGSKKDIGNCHIYRRNEKKSFLLKPMGRHSPDGFQWGYGGSGPAETALCILRDFVQLAGEDVADYNFVDNNYQQFKWDFISKIDGDLKINGYDIFQWIKSVKNN